jgi:hypothetical protein
MLTDTVLYFLILFLFVEEVSREILSKNYRKEPEKSKLLTRSCQRLSAWKTRMENRHNGLPVYHCLSMDIQAQYGRTIFPITLLLRAQIILHSLPERLHITEELPRQLLVLLGFFLHFRARSNLLAHLFGKTKGCFTLTWSNRCHYVAKKISLHEKAKNGLKILRLPTVSWQFCLIEKTRIKRCLNHFINSVSARAKPLD